MKMSKEEAKANDNDLNINKIFAPDMDDCSGNNYTDDIDELEYDEDNHAIFPF